MRSYRGVLCATAVVVVLWSGRLLAQEGLPTLAEASEVSRQTGRPILAMAGQKT